MISPLDQQLSRSLQEAARSFDMHAPEAFPTPPTAGERGQLTTLRRRGEFATAGNTALLELRRGDDGVLRWQDGFLGGGDIALGALLDSPLPRRAVLPGAREEDGRFVAQLQFERLKPNAIGGWLNTLDAKLTPLTRGLLRLDATGARWEPAGKLPASGRLLLLVHGTFSSSANFLKELQETAEGRALLEQALKDYGAVLAFEHSTLSVSPWINAVELMRELDATGADIDVIAHSRGGLVTRWWADCLDRRERQRRCVFVGSPLAGTSLAAPAAIRSSLDLFTNVASALEGAAGLGSSMIPLLSVVAGLLKIVGSVTEVAAKLPIVDAVIAAIPGLAAQSATDNNFELQCLRRSKAPRNTSHYAVVSDFQPEAIGWKFWRYFSSFGPGANALADRVIFRQENDLVIDCAHMTSLADDGPAATLAKAKVLALGANAEVWHCNYFRSSKVLQWIRGQLG